MVICSVKLIMDVVAICLPLNVELQVSGPGLMSCCWAYVVSVLDLRAEEVEGRV